MASHNITIGIDVGGIKKGFHAVANRNGVYLAQLHSSNADEIATWVLDHQPSVIAIDAPSMFSPQGNSRQAESLVYGIYQSSGIYMYFYNNE